MVADPLALPDSKFNIFNSSLAQLPSYNVFSNNKSEPYSLNTQTIKFCRVLNSYHLHCIGTPSVVGMFGLLPYTLFSDSHCSSTTVRSLNCSGTIHATLRHSHINVNTCPYYV